jgi:hypothetical protein
MRNAENNTFILFSEKKYILNRNLFGVVPEGFRYCA